MNSNDLSQTKTDSSNMPSAASWSTRAEADIEKLKMDAEHLQYERDEARAELERERRWRLADSKLPKGEHPMMRQQLEALAETCDGLAVEMAVHPLTESAYKLVARDIRSILAAEPEDLESDAQTSWKERKNNAVDLPDM